MFEIHCFAELYLGNAIEVLQWEILPFCIVYITTDCVTFGLIQWSFRDLLRYIENSKKLLFSKVTLIFNFFS